MQIHGHCSFIQIQKLPVLECLIPRRIVIHQVMRSAPHVIAHRVEPAQAL